MKPHIKNLKCFRQVAAVIGESRAQLELWKVVHADNFKGDASFERNTLKLAFLWSHSPQGYMFWESIIKGINPYTSDHLTD